MTNHQPAPAPLLPADPVIATHKMIKFSKELLDLAERESQALVQNDMLTFAILQDEKEKISAQYMAASAEFRRRLDSFRAVEKGLMMRLEQLQRTLSEKSHSNNIIVENIRRRSERNTHQTLLAAQEMGQTRRIYFGGDSNASNTGA